MIVVISYLLTLVDPDSDEFQICEIEVKKMYITVEKKVSALLQEELRQVWVFIFLYYRILITLHTYLRDTHAIVFSSLLRTLVLLEQVVGVYLKN